jgi:2-keto-4-pentenoate hydratase
MTAAQLLANARTGPRRLAELPANVRPVSIDSAYAVQAELIPKLLAHFGGEAIGYKIACTNAIAQQQLHVEHPFFGRLLAATTLESPARLNARHYFMRVMEAEFGFQMARDLAPIGGERSREEVADAVAGVMAGIEVVDSRFDSWTTIGTPSLIADNACHAAWIRGPLLRDWRGVDLAAQKVTLTINGVLKGEGSGAAVLGHPLNALTWLANALNARGMGLRAGDSITTGVTTDIYLAEAGDSVVADFGRVGVVKLEIT